MNTGPGTRAGHVHGRLDLFPHTWHHTPCVRAGRGPITQRMNTIRAISATICLWPILVGLVLLPALLGGCVPDEPPLMAGPVMAVVPPEKWPVLADDLDRESLYLSMDRSRKYLNRVPPRTTFPYGPDT